MKKLPLILLVLLLGFFPFPRVHACEACVKILYGPGSADRNWGGARGFDTTLTPRTHWLISTDTINSVREMDGGYSIEATSHEVAEWAKTSNTPSSYSFLTHVHHSEPDGKCSGDGIEEWPPSCSRTFTNATAKAGIEYVDDYRSSHIGYLSDESLSDSEDQKAMEGFEGFEYNGNYFTSTDQEVITLSREYPLKEFLADLLQDLINSFTSSTAWTTTPQHGAFAYTGGGEPTDSASESGFLYKFQVSAEDKVPYRLKWEEIHQYPSAPPMIVRKSCVVDGSADDGSGVVESDIFMAAPEGGVESTVSIRFLSASPEIPIDRNCFGCTKFVGSQKEHQASTIKGPSMVMDMGQSNYGQWAGEFFYQYNPRMHDYHEYPMASPIHLDFIGPTSGGTVVTRDSEGSITNVVTYQMEADVKIVDAYTYHVKFYLRANNARISETPFAVWTLNNPDGGSGATRLYLNETRDGSTTENYFEYAHGTNYNGWVGLLANGLREEHWKMTRDVSGVSDTFEVYAPGTTNVLSRITSAYTTLGDETMALLSEQNGGDKPATFEYDTSDNLSYATFSDGSWRSFSGYTGRTPGVIWAPFLNSLVDDPEEDQRVTEVSFATQSSSVDDKSIMPEAPRRVTQKIAGKTVEQSFRILSADRIEYRRGQNSEATTTSTDDLVTVVNNVSSGAFRKEPASILHENGVSEAFFYTTNTTSKTTTRLAGEHSGDITNIVKGTKTVTQIGIAGDLIAETVYSIPGNFQIFSKTTTAADDLRRPIRVDYMDGTFEGYSYDCCAVSTQTNRDGAVVYYTYDALKRKLTETREGVTLIYGYDAADRLLSLTRLGTNGNSHPVFTRGYSLEGRLLAETNALGNFVTFQQSTNAAGETVRTATFPNLATWTERTALDGTLQEVSGTAARPFKFYYGAEATADTGTNGPANAYFTKVARVDSGGGESEWTKTYSDMLGRNYKRLFAAGSGSPMERVWYDGKGQLAREQDADGVSWLYLYNKRGELEFEVLDLDRDGVVDWDGTDRITQWTNEVASVSGTALIRLHQYAWETDGVNASNLVSTLEMTGDWLTARRILWNGAAGVTNSLVRTVGSAGAQQLKLSQPWGENLYAEFTRGRLQAVTRRATNNAQLEKRSFSYDEYGRLRFETDARDGASTLGYDNADELVSYTSPAPGTGGAAQVLSNYFNNMGWLSGQRLPDGSGWTNFYTARGELWKSYGSLSYPVEYSYDAQGRLKTLKTWQDFAGNLGTATTTWSYDVYRGFLTGKSYAGGTSAGPSYTYTAAGRLASRLWARGTNTVYGYDNGGGPNSISYNDGATPGVTRTADRRGRAKTLTQNSITTTLEYGGAGQRLKESYSGGILDGLAVTNSYDGFLRRSSTILANYSGTLNSYSYDVTSGKLATVGDGTVSATYSYLTNSPLASQILFKQRAFVRLTTTKAYDFLDRMSSILSTPAGTNMAGVGANYIYNDLNQRVSEIAGDGQWNYGYDSIGQLTSGKKSWENGVPVEGQQFQYAYDDIGNRKTTWEGGNIYGSNLRAATYTANTLNQYTTRSVPSKVDILGNSTSGNTVQVNSSNADYRRGPYFRKELSVSNTGTNAIWQSVTVTAGSDTVTGNLFIPGTTQNFSYDADGNLTNDYTQAYIYNGENQLTEVRPLTNSPSASKKWLTFTYDFAGRRIAKTVAVWTNSAWLITVNNRFLYDRWNLIGELNATNNALIRGYIWGQDLSGTIHGAGGVGGLIAINDTVNGTHFATHDGKGNVTALLNATTGAYSAIYEYDPYGRLLRATGPMAAKNPFHFSDKYEDTEVGLTYYGYRYYNPSLARWQSRDPIEEFGGFNVSAFVSNDPVDLDDSLGLDIYDDVIDWVGGFIDYGGPTYSPPLVPFQTPEDMSLPSWGSLIENNFEGETGGAVAERLLTEPPKLAADLYGPDPKLAALVVGGTALKECRFIKKVEDTIAREGPKLYRRLKQSVKARKIAKDNYRGRYNAARHAQGKARLPDDYDAHHRIPQEYRNHSEFKKFDFDAAENIQGVKGSRSDVNIHQNISNDWAVFRERYPDASRSQIEEFAKAIDRLYDQHWFK